MRRVLAVALLLILAAPRVLAHPVPFSYLDLRIRQGGIDATLVVHIIDLAHDLNISNPDRLLGPNFAQSRAGDIAALLGSRLTITVDGRTVTPIWSDVEALVDRQAIRARLTYGLEAAPGRTKVHALLFPYEEEHQTFVNIYEEGGLTQAILGRNKPEYEYVSGTSSGMRAVLGKFVPAGIHHILIGPDHLLFLVGLLLLGGTLKRLALIVTGFTVAHSITLSLAVLNVLTPPASIIEPAIALSIVYVGADNLLIKQGRDYRTWIAFAFGFIHGFGFASVLREMDLPSQAVGLTLFSFNLGVEIGQLAVVAVVAAVFAVVRSQGPVASRRLVVAGSIVVIAAGAFWFVQRVFGL